MDNGRKGFTLIELLVVVLIIGILASIAIPQYMKIVERSRYSEAVTLFGEIASAQERAMARKGNYVGTYAELDVTLKDSGGSDCSSNSCDFKYYTIAITGSSSGFTATATRKSPVPAKYGNYTAIYTGGTGTNSIVISGAASADLAQ